MTFLATYDGVLREPPEGRHNSTSWWPGPWGFRCDDCGAVLPYGCILTQRERRTRPDEARWLGEDRHRCGACEGWVEQIGLGL